MSQEQLGGSVGVSKQTISGWEHGTSRPNADYIRGLCKSLECTADYLLGLADEPTNRWK